MLSASLLLGFNFHVNIFRPCSRKCITSIVQCTPSEVPQTLGARRVTMLGNAMQGCMDSNIQLELGRFATLLSQLLSAGADLEVVDDEV